MNLIHHFLMAPSHLATGVHFAYWRMLNSILGYRVAPFSARYWWTRSRLVSDTCDRVLADPNSWETIIRQPRFRYFDERVVEYSWALARIWQDGGADRFLDVGCVMNTEYCLQRLLRRFRDVHFLNLVSEPLAAHGRVSFHCEDVRASTLSAGSFDTVSCLSTIEHVGGNNSYNFSSPNGTAELAPPRPGENGLAWPRAFESLLHLMKPGGLLLVSTPFGAGKWQDGFYEFGPDDVAKLHELARGANRQLRTRVYGKDESGWRYLSVGDVSFPTLPSSAAGSQAVLLIETL